MQNIRDVQVLVQTSPKLQNRGSERQLDIVLFTVKPQVSTPLLCTPRQNVLGLLPQLRNPRHMYTCTFHLCSSAKLNLNDIYLFSATHAALRLHPHSIQYLLHGNLDRQLGVVCHSLLPALQNAGLASLRLLIISLACPVSSSSSRSISPAPAPAIVAGPAVV